MRILQIINHFCDGGAATVVVETCLEMQRLGHEVEVLTVYAVGPMAQPLIEARITIHNLDIAPDIMTNPQFRKYDWQIPLKMSQIFRKGNFDIIHSHLFPTNYFVSLSSYFFPLGIFVLTEHSEHNRRREKQFLRFPEYLMYTRYHAIIGVGESIREKLLQWQPKLSPRAHSVVNAINSKRFQNIEQDRERLRQKLGVDANTTLIIFIGRLVQLKGVDLLLDVLPEVIEMSRESFCIKIVGVGPLEDVYRQRIIDEHLDDCVEMLGFRNDIPQILTAADIMVLPSRWEGLPMVILEAMASACAVIATEVGDIPNVITHNEDGILIPPNSQKALTNELLRLIQDRFLCQSLGQSAQTTVRARFSIVEHVDDILKIYRKTLS